jgi:outer membrane autotransporter protein
VNADSNTGNDTVYIAGAHSGETYIEVDTGGDVWTSAMIGTVLVLMGEEQGVFSTSQTMTSDLYFYSLYIDERGTTSAENLAAGYSTEVYISSIVQSATDENGRYTAPVQEIASAAGTNYTLWRSLQDTLMHRFGDVHEALGPDGEHTVWARARGARFGARSGPLDWKTSWSAFEGGLDLAAFRSEHSANYLGAGFAYFDGDSTYDVGEGDSSGIVLGLYDTYVRDDGQHVDASFKVTHISTDAKGAGGSGTLSNTGVTLGAEYGWKIPLGGGWFAEPQAQVTVGWMDSDTFVNSIGIRTSVDSATGVWTRAGLRAGWEGRGVQFFAKADWNRDFGGDVDFAMSEGSERLALSHDFGTGWLEYGAGLAVRLGDSAQLWLLADRGHGGSGAPEWSWNAGLRWSF